ncbi:MAG: hypothetical protein LWY06_20200 [Firmicutes bacterium]|nr:hypothetical protein [Bacillota bacterium]
MSFSSKKIITLGVFFALFCLCILPAKADVEISGSLTDISIRNKTITVRTGKKLESKIQFSPNTVFTGEKGQPVQVSSLLPGDHVKVVVSGIPGAARKVTADGEAMAGELIFISDKKLITASGDQALFSPDVCFFLNGRTVDYKELKQGMRVFVRLDASTKLAGSVYAVDLKSGSKSSENRKSIKTVEVSAAKSYRQNSVITVSAKAKPKSYITFDIAGLGKEIPMKEVKPGSYTGSFRLNRQDMRRTYILVGDGSIKNSDYVVYQSAVDVAVSAPVIIPVNPEPDDEIIGKQVEIFAKFNSGGSLIRAESAGIIVDGKPLTSGVEKNVGFISGNAGDLKPGRHSVVVTVSDEAGNSSKKAWAFTVK